MVFIAASFIYIDRFESLCWFTLSISSFFLSDFYAVKPKAIAPDVYIKFQLRSNSPAADGFTD